MNKDLELKLVAKYPEILKDYGGDMRETCMAFGFDYGDGWYQLTDTLLGQIDWYIKQNKGPVTIASQCKEKFGQLRFYYNGGDQYVSGLVDIAEAMSATVCEECGNPGKLDGKGWLVTLCPTCRTERNKKRGTND